MPRRNPKYEALDPVILGNLHRVYRSATVAQWSAGRSWYHQAHHAARTLARKRGITVRAAAGVIASLSPGLAWERNIQEADRVILAWKKSLPIPMAGVYGRKNVDRAVRILCGADPEEAVTGVKISAFYRAMAYPDLDNEAVIDRHAASAALNARGERGGSRREKFSTAEALWLARHYREVARQLHLEPHHLQAIIWTVWRHPTPGHALGVAA